MYLYGPVFSRRLGYSLGVGLLGSRLCSFECLYCQLGRTVKKTCRRYWLVDLKVLSRELEEALLTGRRIDYITISGSGEPTLHRHLDKIIALIKEKAGRRIKVCVITNGSLLWMPQVRKELLAADLVMPSLDAADQKTFLKINRPLKSLTLDKVVSGIAAFSKVYRGDIWLEIMMVKDINDDDASLKGFEQLINRIKPDKVFLNLPQRPSPLVKTSLMPPKDRITKFQRRISNICSLVKARVGSGGTGFSVTGSDILESLRRRPQTLEQLAGGLNTGTKQIDRALKPLLRSKNVRVLLKGKEKFYAL
jgi:wyosine [tRNA(Phe)-imidazoG37] synthetase (radical SAM superfamily)